MSKQIFECVECENGNCYLERDEQWGIEADEKPNKCPYGLEPDWHQIEQEDGE